MAAIDQLLGDVADAGLRARLMAEVARLRDKTTFGLVFEPGSPEHVILNGRRLRKGTTVAKRGGDLSAVFTVTGVQGNQVTCSVEGGAEARFNHDELVPVKRFGEPVFPALRHVESITRGGDSPHHVLIEGENHSALQLLGWMLKGRVDCIYIDPPYNTGATTWMYNNKIVDKNDAYRSSKWLSMMERRLRLAKPLLKDDGVIIITIDENELATLRLLLERPSLFKGWDTHIVSIVHNPRGIQGDNFSVTNEFALFVIPPGKKVVAPRRYRAGEELPQPLRKWGNESKRETARNCFYPIRFKDGVFLEAGPVLPDGQNPECRLRELPDGVLEFWPIDRQGVERKWRYARDTIEDVADNLILVQKPHGLDVVMVTQTAAQKTVWSDSRYAAFSHGTNLVKRLTGKKFPFPKSVYATMDCVEAICRNRLNAVVLDFFAGSGTTLHAVAMMNAVDGGQRRCIAVTNNEVSAEDQKRLRRGGQLPGDREWEERGICRSVTRPRLKAAIEGVSPSGAAVKGDWLTGRTSDRRIATTVRSLDFTDATKLRSGKSRKALAALLGLSDEDLAPDADFFVPEEDEEGPAVLLNPDESEAFIRRLRGLASIGEVFFVTSGDASTDRRLTNELKAACPGKKLPTEERRPLSDGLPANLAYFRLEYLDPHSIEAGRNLDELMPALWLMGGAQGPVAEAVADGADFLIPEGSHFGLLIRPAAFKAFRAALVARPNVEWVFIVEDNPEGFAEMCKLLPSSIPMRQTFRLFRSYLDNFNINRGQE